MEFLEDALLKLMTNILRVVHKHIAIMKCNLFFHYCDSKEILFYYFCSTKLCAKHKKSHEFDLCCWDHVCQVNEQCLVDCFLQEYVKQKKKKKNSFTSVFYRFCFQIQSSFLKCKFLFKDSVDRFRTTYLKMDSTSKMDSFEVVFRKFC